MYLQARFNMSRKIISLILSLVTLLTLVGCNKSDKSSVQAVPDSSDAEKEIQYIDYSDLSLNFSAQVPDDWIQSLSGNQFTITERHTGTYISVVREDYFPEINNYSQESMAQMYNGQGLSLQSFVKETGNSIKVIVSYTTNNIPITEYKYIYWTYDAIYSVNYLVETKYKELYMDVFEKVYSSFKLQTEEKCVSEGYVCIYNPASKLSIEYPINWTYSSLSTGFSVTNQSTQSTVYVEIVDPLEQFDEYTQVDYLSIMQSLASGSSLSSFANKDGKMYGEAFVTNGTRKYWIENVLFDCKTYTLSVTYFSASDYTSVDEAVFAYMLETVTHY